MPIAKGNKLMQHINYRVRVTLQDTRIFIGTFKAFDKHMNLILADCEEFRELTRHRRNIETPIEQRRVLGFILLRGQNIVSVTVEGPPPGEYPRVPNARNASRGSGLKYAAGQEMPSLMPLVAIMSDLQGPVRGVGGPPADSIVPNNMNSNKPSLMGLLTQVMPPLAPTINNGQPPMPGLGRGEPPSTPDEGPKRPPPMPSMSKSESTTMANRDQGRSLPLPEISQIGLPPLPEMNRMGPPPLPETSQMGPPPLPETSRMRPLPSPTMPNNNKRQPLQK